MKVFNVIRSQEWWTYKLPPLLAIGYATTLLSSVPLYKVAAWLLFLLSSMVVGAIYVSVINDITDLEEDLASGKSNRIQQIPSKVRWIIPIICIAAGCLFGYFLYPDLLSCLLYSLSWIVFSLYSIKPIRLKNRGIFGVLADCCGSHVFPSLLIVSSVSYITHSKIDIVWFCVIGIWSVCYGLRGILWHQFLDRENDMKVNLNTYASKIEPKDFKHKTIAIITIELIALAILLFKLSLIETYIALILYFVLVYIRHYWFANKLIIIIINYKNTPYQILMAGYYQVLFPLSLLVSASINNFYCVVILILHIVLFPSSLLETIAQYLLALKTLYYKIQYKFRNSKD